MGRQVTMKDIAAEMNVSIVTVSKALSGKDGVSEKLREEIVRKANQMGYILKAEQRKNQLRNTNIAILISERFISDNAFYFKVYQKMIMELSAKGFIGILEIINLEDEERGVLPKVVQMNTVDQVVIVGEMQGAFIDNLYKTGVGLVFFDFENEEYDVDSIIGDNVSGGYTMTRYLVKKGYKNIGFVGSYKATQSILDRLVGHLKYKLAKGLPQKDIWIIQDRNRSGKYIELKLPSDMPDAFFCNCDEVAYRMIGTLNAAGYRVPEDIAVVGYDDYAAQIPDGVELTTYRVDTDEMIRQCVHIVEQRSMNTSYRRGIVLVHGKLVERNTVIDKM